MKPTAIERYTAALAAARDEYDRAMEAARKEAAISSTTNAPSDARANANRLAAVAIDDYIKALQEARRGYARAMEAAARAANQ